MNILFVCKRANNKEKIIKKIYYNNNKIISLKIDEKAFSNKLVEYTIKMLLKWHFGTDKTYVVMSDEFESNIKAIKYIKSVLKNIIIVTDQNNLLKNDYIYINEYINEKELKRKDIKVLVIIDRISNIEKEKIKELIGKYKVVDIYSTRKNENLDRFVDELNNNLGTTIQILDKIELIHKFSLSTAEVENEIFYKGSDLSGVVVAVGKVIDIDIVITAKEVCNYLVILGTVDFGIKTSCQDRPFRSSPFEVRSKIEVLLIDMALFLDIFGAVSALAAISHLVCHIDIVETVPVDMDNIRIG